MVGTHRVRKGDCVVSIAEEHGHFWETVWNHAGNSGIREARGDPHLLVPGDVLEIPDLREKTQSVDPGARYRFRRKGIPATLRIRVLRDGEPRSNQPFRIDVDGTLTSGTTDADGLVEVSIPGTASKATLHVGSATNEDVYELRLGHLEPLSEVRGVKQRLKSLGYEVGAIDGDDSADAFLRALSAFQGDAEIEVTAQLDEATRGKLEEIYGC